MSGQDDAELEPTDRHRPPGGGGGRRSSPGGTRAGDLAVSVRPQSAILVAVLLAVVVALVLLGRQVAGQDTSAVPPGPEESATVAGAETEQQRLEVVAAAEAVLRTWSRPDLGYREWWRALRGLMTSGGRQAYAYTDPAQVPRLGEIEATDVRMSPSGTTATVFFSSDAGRFGVDLSRDDVGSGWLANRIVFPGSESMFG